MEAMPGIKPSTGLLQSASENTAAWLAFLCDEWQSSDTTVSEFDFISDTIQTKLYNEAFADWSTALEAMSDEQRKWMLNLSDVLEGQNVTSLFHYNMGLRPLLCSYLQPVQPGSNRLFLNSSVHRKIIQVFCSEFLSIDFLKWWICRTSSMRMAHSLGKLLALRFPIGHIGKPAVFLSSWVRCFW